MRLRFLSAGIMLPALLAGCTANPGNSAQAELMAYCRVASRAGLNSWVGALVTTCTVEDETQEGSCRLSRVGATALEAVSLPSQVVEPVWAAETPSALFVLTDEGQLLRLSGSEVEVISPLARDPSLASSGDRVVFLAPPEGVTEWDIDTPALIQSYTIRNRQVSTVTQDEFAFAPYAVPRSSDVIFSSTRTGVAAIFRVSPGGEPTQLTNVGMTTLEQESVPPLTNQTLWADDGVYFAYMSDTNQSILLHLNIDTGVVRDVGPGFWPRLDANSDILALAPSESTPCAFVYQAGGAQ